MERYKCSKCNATFNYHNPFDMEKSDHEAVKLLISHCPYCGSFDYILTEYGRLMEERKLKLDKIGKTRGHI
jgi:DNA-directed RNA polymerase subunit RPC12/RpoP